MVATGKPEKLEIKFVEDKLSLNEPNKMYSKTKNVLNILYLSRRDALLASATVRIPTHLINRSVEEFLA